MKKIVLALTAVIGFTVVSVAQDKVYKPVAGMSSLEVTFDPSTIFNANNAGPTFALPSIGGLNNGVKYRNWMSENTVRRGTFLLGFKNISVPTILFKTNGDKVDAQNSYFEWAVQIRPGMEKHFTGTKRLSPYLGSELIVGLGASKYTEQALNASDEIIEATIKNGAQDFAGNYLRWTYVNGFTIGAGLLAGFDYYIAESLYLGIEMNYAFVYNNRFKVVTEVPGNDKIETKSGSNWIFNPSAGANFRLGWNF
jgi:outer membrane protein W